MTVKNVVKPLNYIGLYWALSTEFTQDMMLAEEVVAETSPAGPARAQPEKSFLRS